MNEFIWKETLVLQWAAQHFQTGMIRYDGQTLTDNLLCVKKQREIPVVYFKGAPVGVNTEAREVSVRISCVGTGKPVEHIFSSAKYLGTTMHQNDRLVLHWYGEVLI